MHIERSDNMLHPKLGENGLELFCYISDAIDETLDEAMAAWGNGNEEVAISTRFTLSDALNSAIDMHEMPAYDKAIDADAKPMFDAMRAELVAMIERIDALIFATPNAGDTAHECVVAIRERAALNPRFANVSCSQCGRDFGPGDHGFSHCENHGF